MNDRLWPAIRRRLPSKYANPYSRDPVLCDHGGTGPGYLQSELEWAACMPSPHWRVWCGVCGARAEGWVNEIEAETEQEEAMRFRREPPKSEFTEALRASLPEIRGCTHDRSMTWSTVRGMKPTFYEVRCDDCGAQGYYNRETGNKEAVVKTSTQRKIDNLQRQIDQLKIDASYEQQLVDDLESLTNGRVIRFDAPFSSGGRVYTYAAVKSDGRWSTTGPQSPKSYSSAEFGYWLVHTAKVEAVRLLDPSFVRILGRS